MELLKGQWAHEEASLETRLDFSTSENSRNQFTMELCELNSKYLDCTINSPQISDKSDDFAEKRTIFPEIFVERCEIIERENWFHQKH